MRRLIALFGIALGLLLTHPILSPAQTPAATIELTGGSVAAGIGYTWGSGTLIFEGKRYPLKVSGLHLASVGVNEYTASGSVEGLQKPDDISGSYSAAGVGATLGGGGGVAALRNLSNGVVIHLTGTSAGLSLSLDVGGMRITRA